MGRDIDLTDNGAAIFREAVGNGVAAVTVDAPADLTGVAGSYAMELLDQLPGSEQFLKIDAAGKWTTNAGASGTLDNAYDSGGPGVGRVILVDSGPLELAGPDGLRLNATIPKVEFETDITDFNYRISASATANKLLFQRGDQDADISDDAFVTILSIDELRMVGINTANPQEALHVTVASDIDAKVRVQSPIGRDATVVFMEDSTARYEVGYDDSAAGFLIGRLNFTNPAIFVEDFAGHVHIGAATAPASNARLQVSEAGSLVGLFTSATGLSRLALEASGTTSPVHVGVHAQADTLILFAGATNSVIVSAGGFLFATNWNISAAGDGTFTGDGVFGSVSDATDHIVEVRAGAIQSATIQLGLTAAGSGQGLIRWNVASDSLLLQADTSSNAVAILRTVGGLAVGVVSGAISGSNQLILANGTVPTTSPNNGVQLYSQDVTASAELHVRDEAGNISVLSPHAERHGHKLSEDMAWSFYSERDGKYVWVDMLRVVRLLEGLTGEDLAFMGKAA